MLKDCSQKKGQIEMDTYRSCYILPYQTVRPPASQAVGFRAGHFRACEKAVGADYERLDRPK